MRRTLFTIRVTWLGILVTLGLLLVIPAALIALSFVVQTSDGGSEPRPHDAPGGTLAAVPGATTTLRLRDGSEVRATIVNIWNPAQPNLSIAVTGPDAARDPAAWTIVLDSGTEIVLAAAAGDTPGQVRLFVDRPLPAGATWTAVKYNPAGASAPVLFARMP